jgi:hypothetical protein
VRHAAKLPSSTRPAVRKATALAPQVLYPEKEITRLYTLRTLESGWYLAFVRQYIEETSAAADNQPAAQAAVQLAAAGVETK